MIHKPFPAEHPYASHIPRLKMFPSFATTAEEQKRGIEALNTQPLSSETPAANFDVQIVHKTKGMYLNGLVISHSELHVQVHVVYVYVFLVINNSGYRD